MLLGRWSLYEILSTVIELRAAFVFLDTLIGDEDV